MKQLNSVLIIDDNGVDNFISRKILESFSIPKIVQFESATSALDYLITTAEIPQLILLDIRMPGMDGFQFLSQFWDLEVAKNAIEIVMLSSSIDHQDKDEAKMSKCSGFIEKPLSREKLLTQIAILND